MHILLCILFFFLVLAGDISAKTMEDLLKEDWTGQETLLIKSEVKKRLLLAYEDGSPRLADITKKIIPWAIMEGLDTMDVARVIVYMDRSVKAGASFDDSEDLIPLIAKKEIPIRDFVFMVEYNKETKNAKIPEQIRQLFLSTAVEKRWDGYSILAAGRGLILAKGAEMNLNSSAAKLLKAIPAEGFKKSPDAIEFEIRKAIGYDPGMQKIGSAPNLLSNLSRLHEKAKSRDVSIEDLSDVVNESKKVEKTVDDFSEINIVPRTRIRPKSEKKEEPVKKTEPTEPELIPDFVDEENAVKEPEVSNNPEDWQILREAALKSAIKPWVGTKYKWGGSSKSGIDCSGFTGAVLTDKKVGVPGKYLPHSSGAQSQSGTGVGKSDLRSGDLMFFSASPNQSKITHVAVAISDSEFAHSSNKGVGYDPMNSKHWSVRFVKARRLFKKVLP